MTLLLKFQIKHATLNHIDGYRLEEMTTFFDDNLFLAQI